MNSPGETSANDALEISMCGHDVHTELLLGASANGPIHTLVLSGHMNAPLGGTQVVAISVLLGDEEVDAICRRLTAQRIAGMLPPGVSLEPAKSRVHITRRIWTGVVQLHRYIARMVAK